MFRDGGVRADPERRVNMLVAEPTRSSPWPEAFESPPFSIGQDFDESPITPELVLVCPELRVRALALLPDRDPDGYLPRPLAAPAALTDSTAHTVATPAEPGGRPLAVLAGAYLLQTLADYTVVGAKLVALAVGLLLLAEFAHVLY